MNKEGTERRLQRLREHVMNNSKAKEDTTPEVAEDTTPEVAEDTTPEVAAKMARARNKK
jgi:hypothetical protein